MTSSQPTWKKIVCLANSRKLSGRCIAGIEVADERRLGWIRPVSGREHGEVSEEERHYEDGSDPQVLDILEIPLLGPSPHAYQRENWLLDPSYYWMKHRRRLEWHDLSSLEDSGSLWLEGSSSTYNGLNDRLSVDVAELKSDSLRFIYVPTIELYVFAPGENFGNPKRRVQARFWHEGTEYWLWITDPAIARKYLMKANGSYRIGEAYLTVSLGEPYDGDVYKLVAALVTPRRARRGASDG